MRCAMSGCGNEAEDGSNYCSEHAPRPTKQTVRNDAGGAGGNPKHPPPGDRKGARGNRV